MPKKEKSTLALAREGKVGKLSIVGDIGFEWFGVSYAQFKRELGELGKVNMLEVDITSNGGVVTDGIAIMNLLKEQDVPVHIYVNGIAASIATVIAMAGDRIFIPDNSLFFVHKPLNLVVGNAEEMRKMADDLDVFEGAIVSSYMRHFKGSDEEIKALMSKESWMSASEVAEKFNNVTVIESGEAKVAAHSEPLALLGDIGIPVETALDRAINKVRNKVQNNQQEVDMPMTPEEKAELVAEITASVVNALKVEDEPESEPAEQEEVPEVPALEIDPENPEAVLAHVEALKKKQLFDATDWKDPESVLAYHKAVFGEKETAPTTNTTPAPSKNGVAEPKFTPEAKKSSVSNMTKYIN